MQLIVPTGVAPEINQRNAARILAAARVGSVISAVHVVVFALQLEATAPVTRQWQLLIIAAHSTMIVLFGLWAATVTLLQRRPARAAAGLPVTAHIIYATVLLIGAGVALVDQLVTPAITPFLIGNVVVGLLLLVPPVWAVLYHAAAYSLFALLMPLFQSNPEVILSNRVNGITAAGLGILLSGIIWHNTVVRLQQERRLQQQHAELEAAVATRDRFLSIISHDLRSPLSGFLGLTQYLADERENLSGGQLERLTASLQASAVGVYQLLENLLTWARTQQGMIQVTPSMVDLWSILQRNLDIYGVTARQANIELLLDCPLDLRIQTDERMLDTVVRNLMSNALRHTPGGGRVRLSAGMSGSGVEIICSDTGSGIPAEVLDSLFDLERRTAHSAQDASLSSGLGLILCHEFIDRLNGYISVESSPGRGSSFRCSLPLSLA